MCDKLKERLFYVGFEKRVKMKEIHRPAATTSTNRPLVGNRERDKWIKKWLILINVNEYKRKCVLHVTSEQISLQASPSYVYKFSLKFVFGAFVTPQSQVSSKISVNSCRPPLQSPLSRVCFVLVFHSTPSVLFVCERILSHNCDVCASVCPVCLCGAPGNFNQALCAGAPECVRPSMSARRICPFTTGGLCVEYKSEALHYLESGRGETPSGGQDTIKLAGQLWPCVISRAAACVLYSGAANLLWWCYMFSPAIVMTHRLEAEDTDLKITCFLWRTRNAATLDDIYALIFL